MYKFIGVSFDELTSLETLKLGNNVVVISFCTIVFEESKTVEEAEELPYDSILVLG